MASEKEHALLNNGRHKRCCTQLKVALESQFPFHEAEVNLAKVASPVRSFPRLGLQ